MSEPLYVVFSMDCERIASESPPGGPETWELSERAIEAYTRTLIDAGFPPTLFCVPECGVRHADLLRDLRSAGADLGMHSHPQSFLDGRYDRYLAEYDRNEQREILAAGLEVLTSAFGDAPTSFRSGNLSASDGTYGLLVELGFTQGSNSLPGRDAPEFAANWVGAVRHPHWANARDRLVPGDLPFFELPITIHPTETTPGGGPLELRIEFGSFDEWHRPIIEAALDDMISSEAPFQTLCIFTHNFHDYADDTDPRTKTLRDIVAHLSAIDGRTVIPASLADLRGHYVNVIGEPT